MDPYVLIEYKGNTLKSSVAKDHGCNPVWNEKLSLWVEYPDPDGHYDLTLKVMDKDTFTKDDCIGEATICVKDIVALGAAKRSAHLEPRKYIVAGIKNKAHSGEIYVGLRFTLKVLVGIPFPNINDVKVVQKKKYNDTFSSSRNLLSGSQWYCHQAFRAMNQAAGRCIRHRFDYGAIIFMDERFRAERNIAYVSKWLRKSIKQYDNFDMSMEGLRSFFQDTKELFGQKVTANVETSDLNEESTPSTEQKDLSKGPTKRKVQKCCKLDQPDERKVVSKNIIPAVKSGLRLLPRSLTSLRNDGAAFPRLNAQSIDEAKTFTQADEYETEDCRGYNFGCNAHKDSRPESSISMTSCDTPGPLSAVKGTPSMSANIDMSSPTVLSNEDNSNSTIVEATNEFSDQLSFHSATGANSSGVVTEDTCALGSTPERTMNNDICNLKPEMESSLNLSVNSHTEKRRKPVTSSLSNYSEMAEDQVYGSGCPGLGPT